MATAKQRVEQTEQRLFGRYGLEVGSSTIQIRGPWLQLRVLETGQGSPIVFLHGAGEISSQWAPLWAQLEGFRCFGVDLPGFGLSQEIDYHHTNLREFAVTVVRRTLDELGLERAPVVGNSLGGAFGLWTAFDQPERISQLALLGAPDPAVKGAKVNLPLATLGVLGVNRFIMNLPVPPLSVNRTMYKLTLGRHAIDRSPDEIVEVAHHAMDRPTFAPSMTSYMEAVYHVTRPKDRYVLSKEELAKIDVPTLVVWGEHDAFGGTKIARRLASNLPDARLEIVGGGHNPWLDHPKKCAALLEDFLGDHD
ncbi:MAG: alpha/beta fold hydrolase [Nitriliruptorales bacterium]